MKWITFFFSFFFLALLNGQSVADDIKNYNIGNQWIFGTAQGMGPDLRIDFRSNDIQDSYLDGSKTVYAMKDGESFYVEDDKMYFWDRYYEEYIMYYDWNETDSYEIKYYDMFRESEEVAIVYIDSISYKHFGNDSIKVQHVRIENNGTLEDADLYEIVYEGIGAGNFEIKFMLGCGLCDPYLWWTTELRCFINDTRTYSFVPYDCDSTWTVVDVIDAIQEDLVLFPNPTTSKVSIEGLDYDVDYELYNMQGQLVKKDRTNGLSFAIETSGMYIVRFMVDNQWVQRKVVRE